MMGCTVMTASQLKAVQDDARFQALSQCPKPTKVEPKVITKTQTIKVKEPVVCKITTLEDPSWMVTIDKRQFKTKSSYIVALESNQQELKNKIRQSIIEYRKCLKDLK